MGCPDLAKVIFYLFLDEKMKQEYAGAKFFLATASESA
jgi:hypothetical protein